MLYLAFEPLLAHRMPAVPLQCPTCAGLIQIEIALAGQPVACPLCHSGMVVPHEQALWDMLAATGGMAPPPTPRPEDLLTLGCPICAGPFQALAGMMGQQVACPHCGAGVIVPSQQFPAGALQGEVPEEVVSAEALLPPGVMPLPSDAVLPIAVSPSTLPLEKVEETRTARRRERERGFIPPSPDDLLPPGMGGRQSARGAASPAARLNTDERLPPDRSGGKPQRSTEDGLSPPLSPIEASPKGRDLDDLLPPGSVPKAVAPAARIAPPGAARVESDSSAASAVPINDLLPPGALATEPSTPPSTRPSIEALLPPGAANARPVPVPLTTPANVVDSLLPPGASPGSPAVAGQQVAIPSATKRLSGQRRNLPAGAIVVPTPDGGFVTITETPKTIGEGDEEIELRRLTSEEKTQRRFRKNLLLGGFCLAILVIVIVILLW